MGRAGRMPIYVPNGVGKWPTEPRAELEPLGLADRRYVLFAARLVPEKGCHVLLDAFDRIRPPGIDLVVAGEDLYNGQYAQRLRRHEGPHVRFVGAVLGARFRALVQHADGLASVIDHRYSTDAPGCQYRRSFPQRQVLVNRHGVRRHQTTGC